MLEAVVVSEPDRSYVPWGMLAAIDLHGCEYRALADPDSLRAFVPALVDAIGMKAHGPLLLERFGDGDLEGWSAMQFIETSSITIHADEVSGRCFVDVFCASRSIPSARRPWPSSTSTARRRCACSAGDRLEGNPVPPRPRAARGHAVPPGGRRPAHATAGIERRATEEAVMQEFAGPRARRFRCREPLRRRADGARAAALAIDLGAAVATFLEELVAIDAEHRPARRRAEPVRCPGAGAARCG